jgi:hypothetical protein
MARQGRPKRQNRPSGRADLSKFTELFRLLGQLGGPARARTLSAARRREIGREGAKARWRKSSNRG